MVTKTANYPSSYTTKETSAPVADSRWLWRFITKQRKAGLLALAFGTVGGITSALEPYVVGQIIDAIRRPELVAANLAPITEAAPQLTQALVNQVQQNIPNELGQLTILLLALAVVTMIAFFGQRQYSGDIAYSVNYDIRRVLFDNMLTLEQGFYQRYPTGDLISRMHSDMVLIWRLLAITFTRLGSAFFLLVATFVLLASVSLTLTAITFVVLAVSTAVQVRAGLILAPVFEQVQDQGGAVAALVQDSISGIQTIKTAGKEAEVAQQYARENTEYRRRWLFFRRRNEPVGMLPNAISETTAAIVVLFGGILTLNGQLTLGDFTSFLLYLAVISTALLQIGTVYQRYQQTRGALTRITPLLQHATITSAPQAQPLPAVRGEIVFDGVTVEAEGTKILDNISLRIPAGSVVGIVGPTGSGKTVLVNLLARVQDPTSGRVLIDGQDVRTLELDTLRSLIAYVPQSTFLFSQPLHANVRMGKDDYTDDDLYNAISISRVSNDLQQLPEGLDTLVGEKGVMLSGGQKQRVAIARAVIRDPSVLILDDALSSVDTQTAADILAELRKVLRTRTSLIIAHRMATVKDADRIIVIAEGKISEQGTHEELIAANGMYARMVEREMKEQTFDDVL